MSTPLHRAGSGAAPLLNERLAPKKKHVLGPLLLVFGILVFLGAGIYGYLESQRTERVVVALAPIPYGQRITADQLGTIELALHRPVQVAGLPNPQAIIGQYAARTIGVNDILKPDMLMTAPPAQPVFPNGRELPINMTTIPFPVSAIGPVRDTDTVNVGYNDASGTPDLCMELGGAPAPSRPQIEARPALRAGPPANSTVADRAANGESTIGAPYACRLMQGIEILYVESGTAYLSVTPYQALALQALTAQGIQLWGELYGRISDPLPAMDRLSPEQIQLDPLTRLVVEPNMPDAPATDDPTDESANTEN